MTEMLLVARAVVWCDKRLCFKSGSESFNGECFGPREPIRSKFNRVQLNTTNGLEVREGTLGVITKVVSKLLPETFV